nr:chitobiase/beta-hexosaminidase C-terminal domain-containing protein [Planctomycetota bacterium]
MHRYALLAFLLAITLPAWSLDAPDVKPNGGTYDHTVMVVIKQQPKEADTRISIDGSAITPLSSLYSRPIQLATTTTLRVQSFLDGVASQEVVVTYIITGVNKVGATPTFSPAPGTYSVPVSVAISSTTPGTSIHYSTDGTEPTVASPTYATPITVSSNTTVRARGFANGYFEGAVAVGVYAFQVAPPTASPAAGTYNAPQDVFLATATPSALIYYSLDGSTPTTSSFLASGPIHLAASATITARAFRTGWTESTSLVASYVIANQPANQPPSFTKGADQTGLEDSGVHTVSGWAT